jgi:hypothetical protein
MCRPRNQFQLKSANVNTSRMSALGQKRTLFKAPFYDCFAPKSGHVSAWDGRNYFEYTPLIKSTTECRRSYRRVSRPLVRLARSAIFSIALGQPRSSSFMAFSVPRYLGRSRARLAGRPDIWPSQALWPDAHAPAFSMPRSRRNGLIRNFTAPAILDVAGKTGIAINLVHLRVSFGHTRTRLLPPLSRFVSHPAVAHAVEEIDDEAAQKPCAKPEPRVAGQSEHKQYRR